MAPFRWIVIYKVDSATYLLSNRGLFVVAIFIVVCARIVLIFFIFVDPEESD